MAESLMEVTRRLLQESEMSIADVHAELHSTGSDITFYWLRKFSSGNIKDPSVNRVEELYTYLTGEAVLIATS